MTDIDNLLSHIEQQSNCCSMLGVPVVLRPADAFVILEWVKSLIAERDTLRRVLEVVICQSRMTAAEIATFAEKELDKLYAKPTAPVEYIQTRQE